MNTIKINITKDPNYGFSNLEFSEKPTTEMLQELKNNGWRYSSHFKRWYPATEEAKKNAESFAQDYYRHYTSEEQTKTIKTAESLVDLNSIENAVDSYISEKEKEMQKGNYNAFIEVQDFVKNNSFITPKVSSYINRFIHSIEDIKGVTAFVAYGSGFYSYDTGVSLISELNKKIENYESIKNNPGQNDYSDLLKMIKDELKMIDNSRNKGTLYNVLQKEGDSYEQKIRRSNERNNGDGRTDYSGESGNSLGNKVEEQRSVHNSDKISDPAGHSDSKMHDGQDSGRSTELEANGTSADIQRQRLQSNALEQEKLSETDKVNDSTRDAGNGTQNLSEGRVEVYSVERKGSIGAVGNGLNKYGEIRNEILRKFNIADNYNELSDRETVALRELLSDKNRNREFKNESERRFAEACWKSYDAFREQEKHMKFIQSVINRLPGTKSLHACLRLLKNQDLVSILK